VATRPDDLTSPHAEPNHYDRYGFCRVGCAECDRLDHEEMGQGMPTAEALSRGVMLALIAVDGERVDDAQP
jgi:hypothetical protein